MAEDDPTPEAGTPSPDEMAEQLGCAVEELAEVMTAKLAEVQKTMEDLQRRMNPPKPNRAQRRAAARGGRMPNATVVRRGRHL